MINQSQVLYANLLELENESVEAIRKATNETTTYFDPFSDLEGNTVEATDGNCVFLSGGDYYIIDEMSIVDLLQLLTHVENALNFKP